MSISVWAAIGMPAFILALGLGVDFAGHTAAQEEARQVAGEAARAGAQGADIGRARIKADPEEAQAKAEEFAVGSGYLASSAAVDADGVKVTIRGEYETVFLGVIGVYTLPYEVSSQSDFFTGSDRGR